MFLMAPSKSTRGLSLWNGYLWPREGTLTAANTPTCNPPNRPNLKKEARDSGNNNGATKEEARGKNKSDPVSHIPHQRPAIS